VRTTNEIAYADDQGVMQFLRRSLLAGAYKFDERHSQVLPRRFLAYFQTYISYVSTLICIGYGFGDIHINMAMRRWLETARTARLVIVGPGAKVIPASLLHLAPQIELVDQTATDYLEQFAIHPLSRAESVEKKIRDELLAMPLPHDPIERQQKIVTIVMQDVLDAINVTTTQETPPS